MISMDTIRAMADFIVAKFDPERIVLFGSYASGQATEDSDVDLLVEVREELHGDGWANPIHHALVEQFGVPTDIFIRTSEAVLKYRDNGNTIVHEALFTGKLMYEKRGL